MSCRIWKHLHKVYISQCSVFCKVPIQACNHVLKNAKKENYEFEIVVVLGITIWMHNLSVY